MSDPRDTQFSGFAKLLFDELYNNDDMFFDTADPHWHEEWQKVIARRAFDLVGHALDHAYTHNIVFESPEECAASIPDLTQWPEANT